MNPMMNGNIDNFPTEEQLWENEKSHYRHWIIILLVGLMVVLGFLITSTALNLVDKDIIIELMGEGNEDGSATILSNYNRNYVIFPFLTIGSIALGLVFYVISLFSCYKEKSFSYISRWSTWIIGFSALMAVVPLFFNFPPVLDFRGQIFQFITQVTYIIFWFLGASQVSRIRMKFIRAKQIANLKNSPEYQALKNAMNNGSFNSGPFGPQPQQAANPFTGAAGMANPQSQPVNQPVMDPMKQKEQMDKNKLNNLTKNELVNVAKELSIFTNDKMSKDELIDAIMNIYKNHEK